MSNLNFPTNPIREHLYTRDELFGAFDINDSASMEDTLDMRAYKNYIDTGGTFTPEYYQGMMRSIHDFSIWNVLKHVADNHDNKIIAIMGGHKMQRSVNSNYHKVALIAYRLTQEGFICTSGGGPGAMEAAHLGAHFADYSESELFDAIQHLSSRPSLPHDLKNLYHNGAINTKIYQELYQWLLPAFEILQNYPNGGYSFSIPTWHYGHEPATPFATEIAKYYQNSIREEGLLAIAYHGVLFSPGKAGTIQEIFQDATQNYYKSFKWFSPMIFLDKDYWTLQYPVKSVLDALMPNEENNKYLHYLDDIEDIIKAFKNFIPHIS